MPNVTHVIRQRLGIAASISVGPNGALNLSGLVKKVD